MTAVLDTHTVLWYLEKSKELSVLARTTIEDAIRNGRRVGSTDFAYSVALAGRRETWTSRRIVNFVLRPDGMYPGTSMPPVSLTPDLQRDLATYLDTRHRR